MKYGGTVVFSERDEFGYVEIIENSSVRKMHFGTPIEQSAMYRNAPMTLRFEYQQVIVNLLSDLDAIQPKGKPYRILMLGLGGGSMAHHLFHLLSDMQMTIVELRQLVIDCAYRFFHLPDDPAIETTQADAIEYCQTLADDCLQQDCHQYDCIIIDLFNGRGIPPELADHDFHESLSQCVRRGGHLIFNLWNQYSPQQKLEPTKETAEILAFWRAQEGFSMTHHLIKSSTNLILKVCRET